MHSPFSHIWQRIRTILFPRRSGKRMFRLDEASISSLRLISERDHRSEEELASELLTSAIHQRLKADETLSLWEGLSGREQHVIALACLGYSNEEIARRLSIAKDTVKSHIYSGVKKYGVRNKAELLQTLKNYDFGAWEKLPPNS